MKIVVLVDDETVFRDDPDFEGKTDPVREGMEFHIIEALRHSGYEVEVAPFTADVIRNIQRLIETKADLVFNLTEHFRGDRRQDVNIVALLELLGLPYTGTGPTGLMLCRDKAACKRILSHHHIRLPQFITVPVNRKRPRGRMRYPALVKPVYEDGSDGISLASLVHTDEELRERVGVIHERMRQPAICEEFIEGREIYVGIVGNERLRAFPAREVRFGRSGEGGPSFATARVKWDEAYRKKWGISYEHANLPDDLERKVARIGKRIYQLLSLRDYGRIDLRLTSANEVVFLEANPNPNLAWGDDLAEAAEKAGIDHHQLVDRIAKLALRRIHAD